MALVRVKPLSLAVRMALPLVMLQCSAPVLADDGWDESKVEHIEVVGQQGQKYRVDTTTTATKTNTLLR